jgi:hypothetical protein
MSLDGGEYNPRFIEGVGAVEGIAIYAGRIYWANSPGGANAGIGRANLDGGEANASWIVGEQNSLGGVAVDARPSPPTLLMPSLALRFRDKTSYNLRSGAALLGVYVPGQGELTVTSPGLSWAVSKGTVRYPGQGNSYLSFLRIRSGTGRQGKRIRAQLRQRGWARVRVDVTYTEDRFYPATASRKLILRRYPGARGGWVEHPKPPPSKHR